MAFLKYISLLFLGIVLTGCYVGYTPSYYDQDMLVDFPLLPHTAEVSVYFPQDTLPDEEYIRVGVLEVRGDEFTSYNTLIRKLQVQAQKRGVDAIQLMGKQTYLEEGYEESYVLSELSGIGIKYVKNIDYLSEFIKSQEIYFSGRGYNPSDSGRWVAKIWLDFNRQVTQMEGEKNYLQFVRKHSLDYLLYSNSEKWRYTLDEHQQINKRTRVGSAGVQLRVWFSYQVKDLPNFVRIREYPSRKETSIWFAYDAEGRILKKRITLPDGEMIDQILVYDAIGRHTKSEYYWVQANDQLSPYLLVKHQFYSPDDIPQLVVLK
ncbi:MAG: hypothetical protein ACFB15_29370 [Cyclobacteriaceae bacterium]